MKKYSKWILILVGIIVLIGVIWYLFFSQPQNQNNNPSDSSRVSTEIPNSQIEDIQANNIVRKGNSLSYRRTRKRNS